MHGQFVRLSWLIRQVGYVKAKENPEVRRYLRMVGDNFARRIIDQNVWVDLAIKRVRKLHAEGRDVVLTGVRYPNEVAMVDRLDGLAVWVHRPGLTADASHDSESSVDEADFTLTLNNTGTLDDLKAAADRLATEWSSPVTTTATQKVLLDGNVIMDLAAIQPADPTKAIVESHSTGPIVVDRTRIEPVA